MMEASKIIIGILVLLVVLGIVPILIGTMASAHIHRDNADTMTFSYFTGLMIMVAVMQLLSVPMTIRRDRFSELSVCYTVILAAFCILVLIFRRKYLIQMLRRTAGRIRAADKRWILVLICIYGTAVVMSCFTPYIYGDDKTYLAMVNDMLSSDTLYQIEASTGEPVTWTLAKYLLSSYWTWIAYLAKVSGIHPLILCKTILIYVFLPMSYAVQGLLAGFLFHNNERRMFLYMIFLNLVSIFGGFSNYTTTYRLLTWIWQSKAFLAIIVIPFLLYFCSLVFEKKTAFFEFFMIFVLILASASATLTGTGIAVAMVLVLSVIYAVKNRRISQVIGAFLACSPAYIYMLIYIRYDRFLAMFNF